MAPLLVRAGEGGYAPAVARLGYTYRHCQGVTVEGLELIEEKWVKMGEASGEPLGFFESAYALWHTIAMDAGSVRNLKNADYSACFPFLAIISRNAVV
jgi:hypothetical protein